MTFGGQNRVGQLFSAVAQGFVQTRLEIILFFLIVAAFLVVMILLFMAQQRKADEEIAAHARRMARLHRRSSFRKRVRLPVQVARHPADASPRQTTLLDLSCGGASFRNPWEMLRKGDFIHLSFPPSTEGPAVKASVVRVSNGGATIHVKFEYLPESTRARILLFLRGSRQASDPGEILGEGGSGGGTGGDGPTRSRGGDLPAGF